MIALLLPLIVITDPYKGIKYNEITVYVFKKQYNEKVIEVLGPEHEEDNDDHDDTWKDYLNHKYGTGESL